MWEGGCCQGGVALGRSEAFSRLEEEREHLGGHHLKPSGGGGGGGGEGGGGKGGGEGIKKGRMVRKMMRKIRRKKRK